MGKRFGNLVLAMMGLSAISNVLFLIEHIFLIFGLNGLALSCVAFAGSVAVLFVVIAVVILCDVISETVLKE